MIEAWLLLVSGQLIMHGEPLEWKVNYTYTGLMSVAAPTGGGGAAVAPAVAPARGNSTTGAAAAVEGREMVIFSEISTLAARNAFDSESPRCPVSLGIRPWTHPHTPFPRSHWHRRSPMCGAEKRLADRAG